MATKLLASGGGRHALCAVSGLACCGERALCAVLSERIDFSDRKGRGVSARHAGGTGWRLGFRGEDDRAVYDARRTELLQSFEGRRRRTATSMLSKIEDVQLQLLNLNLNFSAFAEEWQAGGL